MGNTISDAIFRFAIPAPDADERRPSYALVDGGLLDAPPETAPFVASSRAPWMPLPPPRWHDTGQPHYAVSLSLQRDFQPYQAQPRGEHPPSLNTHPLSLRRYSGSRADTSLEEISAFRGASNFTINGGTFHVGPLYTPESPPASSSGKPKGDTLSEQLPPRNFRDLQRQNVEEKRAPGTVTWFLQSGAYKKWLRTKRAVPWITGKPGTGKTITVSVVIDDLQRRFANRKDMTVGFAYCRYDESLSVTDILVAMIKQQLEDHPFLEDIIGPTFIQYSRHGTLPSQEDLLDCLRTITAQFDMTFFAIDALDEARDNAQFDLIQTLPSIEANFFFSSRPLRLEEDLPHAHIVELSARDSDVRLFVEKAVESSMLRRLLTPSAMREKVVSTITQKARGMFLHAALQVEYIRSSTSLEDLEIKLHHLPFKMNDLYVQTFKRINQQLDGDPVLARTALLILVHAQEPMTIEDLLHALAVHPEMGYFDSKRLVSEDFLIALCCGLVSVESAWKRGWIKLVRLMHYTAKEALRDLLVDEYGDPHALIALTCIARIASCDILPQSQNADDELWTHYKANPFLEYAHNHWHTHLRRCRNLDGRLMVQFLNACKALKFYSPFLPGGEDMSPVHVAAHFNLPNVLCHLLRENDNSRTSSGFGRFLHTRTPVYGHTPLTLAARCGHGDVVRLLLYARGIDVNFPDRNGNTALICAAREGHQGPVYHLLSVRNVAVDWAHNEEGRTALVWAAAKGYHGIVDQLLSARMPASVNWVDREGRSALMCAAAKGYERTVRHLLLAPGIDVNETDNLRGDTALILAARSGHVGVVKALLMYSGIEVDVLNHEGERARMCALRHGHTEIADLLLHFKTSQRFGEVRKVGSRVVLGE